MSTLEKTISILNDMPEKQIEIVYSYVSFLKKQSEKEKRAKSVDDILDSLIGIIPDQGKTLEDYKDERIAEKYGINDWYQCFVGYYAKKR